MILLFASHNRALSLNSVLMTSDSKHSPPPLAAESGRTYSFAYTLYLPILFPPVSPHPMSSFPLRAENDQMNRVASDRVILDHLLD